MTFDDFIEAIAAAWHARCEIETHMDVELAYELLDKGFCPCKRGEKRPHPLNMDHNIDFRNLIFGKEQT